MLFARYWDKSGQGGWRRILWGSLQSLLGVLLLIAGIVIMGGLIQLYLDVGTLRERIEAFGLLAPLIFIAVAALKNVLFIPIIPLAFLIGLGSLIFGKVCGAFYFWVGTTVGACLAFFIARHWLVDFAARLKRGRLKGLDEVVSGHGFLSIVGLRLIFFSNIPLNFGSGLTSMTLRDYTLGTSIGLMPKTFVVSYVFESVQDLHIWGTIFTYRNSLLLLLLLLSKVGGTLLLAFLAKDYRKNIRIAKEPVA